MKKLLIVALGISLSTITFAESKLGIPNYEQNKPIAPDYSRFEDVTKISVTGIVTPKIVRFKTNNYYNGNTILLNDKNEIISHKWIRKSQKIKSQNITVSEVSSQFEGKPANLVDGNNESFFTFHPETDRTKSTTLNFGELTDVSGIYVTLSDGIINPKTVSVSGKFANGEEVIIVNRKKFSHRIPFPTVAVTQLKISYDTPHFLRLSEIEIMGQEETEKTDELIFFAEEGKDYILYSNSHFGQKHYSSREYQPLTTDSKTPLFSLTSTGKNPFFNNDFDSDGLNDNIDLCPKISDSQNTDIDNNGRGDVCEDPDQDKRMSSFDNCPYKYNPDQKDSDLDKVGDACDEEENRLSENTDYLLWYIFGFAALFLGVLVWRSLKKN